MDIIKEVLVCLLIAKCNLRKIEQGGWKGREEGEGGRGEGGGEGGRKGKEEREGVRSTVCVKPPTHGEQAHSL